MGLYEHSNDSIYSLEARNFSKIFIHLYNQRHTVRHIFTYNEGRLISFAST